MSGKQEWSSVIGVGPMYFFTCPACKCWTGIPVEVERIARARPGLPVYCANGHGTSFPKGESEADKLRRERDQLAQRIAQRDDEIRHQREQREAAERRVSAARGQITKLKKRASNGVCPCCNRTFADLQRHMHTKHPGFVTEPDATEHVH